MHPDLMKKMAETVVVDRLRDAQRREHARADEGGLRASASNRPPQAGSAGRRRTRRRWSPQELAADSNPCR